MRLSGLYRVKKRLNSHPKRPVGKSSLHTVKATIGPLKSTPLQKTVTADLAACRDSILHIETYAYAMNLR